MSSTPNARADAVRNAARIREAALAAFHGRGLETPLRVVAEAAGVSSASIYNHFGGRSGLIDAVIDELIVKRLDTAMARARESRDPWDALAEWIRDRRNLLYDEPAFADVMLQTFRDSQRLSGLADDVTAVTQHLVRDGHEAGVLSEKVSVSDLFWADAAEGLALQRLSRPTREAYLGRVERFIASLRAD